jgi:hypothetical protein
MKRRENERRCERWDRCRAEALSLWIVRRWSLTRVEKQRKGRRRWHKSLDQPVRGDEEVQTVYKREDISVLVKGSQTAGGSNAHRDRFNQDRLMM